MVDGGQQSWVGRLRLVSTASPIFENRSKSQDLLGYGLGWKIRAAKKAVLERLVLKIVR